VLTIKAEGRNKKFLVTLDSKSAIIEQNVELTVMREKFTASIIRLPHHNFVTTLRQKLMWGLDKRN
jgi:NAD+ kinase